MSGYGLADMVPKAPRENLAFPVPVSPPGAPGLFDATGSMDWAVRSDAQNRPMRMTVTYDMGTGREASREGFADGHVIDRVVGYGIAWHEGQLFGWVNQLVGVLRSEEHTSELQSLMSTSYAVLCLTKKLPH